MTPLGELMPNCFADLADRGAVAAVADLVADELVHLPLAVSQLVHYPHGRHPFEKQSNMARHLKYNIRVYTVNSMCTLDWQKTSELNGFKAEFA